MFIRLDEYTEHVNNNAYTSYGPLQRSTGALNIARQFGCSDDALSISAREMFLKELWMPEIQPDGVCAPDSSFMAKPALIWQTTEAAAGSKPCCWIVRARMNEMQITQTS